MWWCVNLVLNNIIVRIIMQTIRQLVLYAKWLVFIQRLYSTSMHDRKKQKKSNKEIKLNNSSEIARVYDEKSND